MPNPNTEPNVSEYCLMVRNGKIQLHHVTCAGDTPLVAQWWIRGSFVTIDTINQHVEAHYQTHI